MINYKGSFQTLSLIAFFLLLAFGSVQAATDRFVKGITAYNEGHYEVAIENFESLARDGLSSPLLYNLANSYAQNGQTGMAILNYERAARLASGDSDIQGNLELLRKEKTLFQEEQSVSQRLIQLLGLDQWTILATVGFVLFTICLLWPVSPRLKTSTRRLVAVVSVLLTVAAAFGMVGQYGHYHDAVVVESDVKLRLSPFESAAASGSIQEGRLLTPVKTHNNYTLVRDETGRSGWLANEHFMFIAQ